MKLVTFKSVMAFAGEVILIHTSVKLVTQCVRIGVCRKAILIHTSVKLVTQRVFAFAHEYVF